MKRLIPAALIVLILPFSAWATDLLAKWRQADGGSFTLAVRDADHIRMDTHPDSYMLLSGKKVYMVSRSEGQWQAMDMDQMSGMMKMFGGQPSATVSGYQTVYRSTGRKEKVAGYPGMVYTAEVRDGQGKLVESKEMVFSDHKDIVLLNQAWLNLAAGMGRVMGPEMSRAIDDASKAASESGYGGVLRVDWDMILASLKKTDLGAAYFNLPGNTTSVAPSAPTRTPVPTAKKSDGAITGAAKETGKEIGGVAASEAKNATMEEVREGVQSVFKKLFD
ncbi:MAG: hypothetical protein JEZ11_00860 [Desulfobacterales bacterium]|nr:hypothetical protein [Desulfobacterales bacterium]